MNLRRTNETGRLVRWFQESGYHIGLDNMWHFDLPFLGHGLKWLTEVYKFWPARKREGHEKGMPSLFKETL